MDEFSPSKLLQSPVVRWLGRAVLYTLAFIGLVWLVGASIARVVFSPFFETSIVRSLPSPDRLAIAEVEVRTGGLGTVWTTRIHLRPNADSEEYWTVYQAKDSDFVPPMRWADRETLLVGLPCERFDYVSNPDDWERSAPPERRLKVRFVYPKDCSPPRL